MKKSDILKTLKVTAIALASSFAMLLILFMVFLGIMRQMFVKETVVDRILSPEGTRFAEIVDSDQGALGGNTVVYVKDTLVTDFLLFSVRNEERIYVGEWREYGNMRVEWISEDCLKINSKEYVIE